MTAQPATDLPAAPTLVEADPAPPRELIFATFLALALGPWFATLLFAQWIPCASVLALPYFLFILLSAQADQDRLRADRSGLDKLAVFLLMLIFPLNAVAFWFAARETARRPKLRVVFWVVAAILLALCAAFVFDWSLLQPAM